MLKAIEKGVSRGVRVGNSPAEVTHLQFAHDIPFMGEWCTRNAKILVKLLHCFEEASGLHINLNKSRMLGVKVDISEVARLALSLRCTAGEFPLTYLGLPIGSNMRRLGSWESVVDKKVRKLNT